MTDVLFPIAEIFNLTLNAFGTEIVAGSGDGGQLVLSRAWGTGLEPSPITPTDNDGAWGILSGTIQAAVFSSTPNAGQIPVVTPTLATGTLFCLADSTMVLMCDSRLQETPVCFLHPDTRSLLTDFLQIPGSTGT